MKNERYRMQRLQLIAVGLSLLLHLVFFTSTRFIIVRGLHALVDQTRKLFNVTLVDRIMPAPFSAASSFGGTPTLEQLRFESPKEVEVEAPAVPRQAATVRQRSETVVDTARRSTEKEDPAGRPADITDKNIRLTEQKRQTREEVIEYDPDKGLDVSKLPRNYHELIPADEFAKTMPGYTPRIFFPRNVNQEKEYRTYPTFGGVPGYMEGKYDVIDSYLMADLAVYQDPSDRRHYFRVTLMAGSKASELEVMPKEVIFLVDRSLSISQERMDEFKQGLLYALDNLNPRDQFNVISFEEKIDRMYPQSVRVTPGSLQQARRFISSFQPAQSTDVYDVFTDIIQTKPRCMPSYVVLLSDGRPTRGVTDSRKIIGHINQLNAGERAIFSFSGGAKVNRYLLDFIAYRNRGWAEYAERSAFIAHGLASLYYKIKDPLLIHVSYQFSHLETGEIYPKELPDFYRGAAFTLYGTYGPEDEFSMQLLGTSLNKRMEFIFADKLSNAREGDASIAREWAFNKIYYLIGKLSETENDDQLLRQIQDLCKKYKITTPYSENIYE